MDVLAALRDGLLSRRPRGARQAMRQAEMLDQVVAAHTRLMPRLIEPERSATTDYLVELVRLGQVYRSYAQGWITKRDMERQARAHSAQLDELRWGRLLTQLADPD